MVWDEKFMVPPAALARSQLPSSDSSRVALRLANPDELEACALLNGESWRGPLSLPGYLRREEFLGGQPLSRNGGQSTFVLVDIDDKARPRNILASCECWRKRALVSRRGGGLEEVISHSIGSVYCRSEYRGLGFAQRAMEELKKALASWQQEDGTISKFNVLYSDIGKAFYAVSQWMPYPAAHISLSPTDVTSDKLPTTSPIFSKDLRGLCATDETLLRQSLQDFQEGGPKTRVAFIPDVATLHWHHSREEFIAKELFSKTPEIKGAVSRNSDGTRAWCIWTHVFGKTQDENTLHVLRFVLDDQKGQQLPTEGTGEANGERSKAVPQDLVHASAACLQAAQQEASRWNMASVELWNPHPIVLAGAKEVSPSCCIIERETESIPCLNWYGSKADPSIVEWVANEKFGWC